MKMYYLLKSYIKEKHLLVPPYHMLILPSLHQRKLHIFGRLFHGLLVGWNKQFEDFNLGSVKFLWSLFSISGNFIDRTIHKLIKKIVNRVIVNGNKPAC